MNMSWINLAYLVASALFILGLKGLGHPRTAVRGNQMGAMGMMIAVIATLTDQQILSFEWIIGGIAVGALIGIVLATRIAMTSMPEMVALLNGFGGVASALVAGAALEELIGAGDTGTQAMVATAASGLIGGVTLFGSLIAFGKLNGMVTGRAVLFPGQRPLNGLIALGVIALAVYMVMTPDPMTYWILVGVACLLGILTTIPIGGADMPVVIALLNSYSGLAAAATGFILSNNVLIVAGSLVGASGLILTKIMCKAMNRSLANVLFGGVGAEPSGNKEDADAVYAGKVKATSPDEVAMLLDGVRRVVFVPGYGLAVAQAQHAVMQLTQLLEKRGVEVLFGVHPVAGRMPGHMNVLLAEADVPYDQLKDMDEINPVFAQTDVVFVLGANDVVNPLARTDPSSPIAGMPILDVDKAHTVVVVKRSLSPGFAGIANPLFALDNSLMLFADAKQAIQGIITAIKEG
jgi:NAD(P) transhydrogenase subunit beta